MRYGPIALTLVICGSASALQAQSTSMQMSRMVSGRVFDDTTGCPLARSNVAVVGPTATGHATTDSHGRYHLMNPPPSPFSLQVLVAGYLPRRVDSVMVTDTAGRVDFSLKRVMPAPTSGVTYPAKKCELEPGGS